MVTAEIAVALPALVLVLTLGLGAVVAVTDQVRCIDASRTAARLLARGEPMNVVSEVARRQAPSDARVLLDVSGADVRAEVVAVLPVVLRHLGVVARPRAVAHAQLEGAP